MNKNESVFAENYFDHDKWIYEPICFYFNNTKYTPDFYDAKRHVFIEVAGTRQAFHSNKRKYMMFMRAYPKTPLEIRDKDGTLMDKTAFIGRRGNTPTKRMGWLKNYKEYLEILENKSPAHKDSIEVQKRILDVYWKTAYISKATGGAVSVLELLDPEE